MGRVYIIDDPNMTFADPTFSDSADEDLSDAEPFNEDDMYGLDPCMTIMSESSDGGEVELKELSDGGDDVEQTSKSDHEDNLSMSKNTDNGEDEETFQGTGNVRNC